MLKPDTEERQAFIVTGIISFYAIIAGFVIYLYFLHRISMMPAVITLLVFTIFYLPRFLIIRELKKLDDVKIVDNFIMVNGVGIDFRDIKDFGVQRYKPKVIFFLNNKMLVYNKADFYIETNCEKISFKVIGRK